MQAVRETIHPRLRELGDELADPLFRMAGEPMHPHVAKHARRSVNPPEDTWVAFGPNQRGYKKYPYVGVAISRFGIHPQVVAKPETWEADDAFWDALLHRMRLKTGSLELGRTLSPEGADADTRLAGLDDFVTIYRVLRGMG